jgi:nucleotide-binding universal stress UspA family protein
MTDESRTRGKSKKAPAIGVGVDGSPGANEALRWALGEGRRRNWPVRAAHAWTLGDLGGSVEGYPLPGSPVEPYTSLGFGLSDLRRAREDLLERALDVRVVERARRSSPRRARRSGRPPGRRHG